MLYPAIELPSICANCKTTVCPLSLVNTTVPVGFMTASTNASLFNGPVGPTAPVSPFTPVSPVGPTEPVGPTAPVAPVGPTGPCGPVAPTSPLGPAMSPSATRTCSFSFESAETVTEPFAETVYFAWTPSNGVPSRSRIWTRRFCVATHFPSAAVFVCVYGAAVPAQSFSDIV